MSNKFNKFEDEDISNKNINLNTPDPTQKQISSNNEDKRPKFLNQMLRNKEDVVAGVIVRNGNNSNTTEEISKNTMSTINTYLSFLGKYFDVEIDEIESKLKSALVPFNKNFYTLAEKNADLYGPFWILTTIIFIITFAANLSNYFNNPEQFVYNFNFVPYAALVIYGFGFGTPIVIFLLMRFVFRVEIALMTNVCVYGYSFAILGPVLLACVIPSDLVEALLLLGWLVCSSFFLLWNVLKFIAEKAEKSKYIILGLILGIQVVLFLTLKFYFYAQVMKKM